ncbi:MAG TPA: aminodeoxychorismate synthase component I [Bacillales bacterium]|nr:aminodeoxychorismate synthase component I [Bacillales bacterium]
MHPSEPQLLFEFPNEQGTVEPLSFTDPVETIVADHVTQVLSALKQIRQRVKQGYFAAGYISYEASPAFDPTYQVHENRELPLLWFGIYEAPSQNVTLQTDRWFQLGEWKMCTDTSVYRKQISAIKQAIAEGATYQTNYTVRMQAEFAGNDYSFYQKMTENHAGYHAYLNIGRHRILSASPELFFRWDGNKIVTRPMKGTSARGRWMEEDEAKAAELLASAKERAENVMIADLLRNDLGRIAKTGSVKTKQMFAIERYPTVLQMTTTVEAETKDRVELEDVFRALFPCGSVTGAPKVNTIRLIQELEDSAREVYCGAIGMIKPGGEAVFNVPIRTVVIDSKVNRAAYGVGGGIAWDSTAEAEAREVMTKARMLTEKQPLFDLLESLKLENGEYVLLERHLRRLQDSADYFSFPVDLQEVKRRLNVFADNHQEEGYKVRLLISRKGSIVVEGSPLTPIADYNDVILAENPVSKDHVFLYHKTTHRSVYETHRKENEKAFDVLLWNEEGELTEFTNGNLVMEMEGYLLTPPRASGLLNGTFREQLLEDGVLGERILKKEDLRRATNIWLINSVRGWVKVNIVMNAID